MDQLFDAIDHVGIAVPDFDEAVRYYADVFGMTVAHEEVNEEQGVREAMLSVGDSEYVQTARLLGATSRRALVRDVLPNVAGPVLVLATLDLANAILLLSGLSFLGLGAQPPKAEWGSMVAEGTQYFQWWWIGTFPGLAIFTVVLAFNFIGDSLRDVFDPRTARRLEEDGR